MKCRISRVVLEALKLEVQEAPGAEICGLLLGEPGLIGAFAPLSNVYRDPSRGFALDPAEHVGAARRAREEGSAVLGHYHSHPSGDATPSSSDAEQAGEEGVYWLILSAADARLWISRRGGFMHGAFEPVLLLLS